MRTSEVELQWHIDNHLTHQIHTSERRAFRACRRRWSWVYQDMYGPLTTPEPLEFGVAFHAAMEAFYEPKMWGKDHDTLVNVAKMAFKVTCDKQLKQYKKLNENPDVVVLQSYKDRVELGIGMIDYYCTAMSPKYDENWKPIRVEVGFEVPIFHPTLDYQLYCKCKVCFAKWCKYTGKNNWSASSSMHQGSSTSSDWRGLPVTYGGRLDALFEDQFGRYWIADWKTTTRVLDEDAESSFLQLDDQVASYLWALNHLGVKCSGFVYVEIKKAVPQAPELLARPYKGRSVSTNKQTLTTYQLALDTIQKHDYAMWARGEYNDYLNWLKIEGPKFTQRNQIHKNSAEIRSVGEAIAYEALDMINDPNVYPQPGRFSCNYCMFRQPCLGKNMDEDYVYTLGTLFEKRTKMYWEEKAENGRSTE